MKKPYSRSKAIKIACVGNSITYGAGIANREKNAYPVQLQNLLGFGYEVQNFGVSGRTLLKKGDKPYWETKAYKKALKFNPDIVYIKLGTNDSKQQNRIYLENFEADYKELITSFRKKNARVRIIALLPIPSFSKDSTYIWDPILKGQIIPKTKSVAYSNGIEIIDLYQLFTDKPGLLPDKVHPSSLGATVIAKRIYENVLLDETTKVNFDEILDASEVSNFHGFKHYHFALNNVPCNSAVIMFRTLCISAAPISGLLAFN